MVGLFVWKSENRSKYLNRILPYGNGGRANLYDIKRCFPKKELRYMIFLATRFNNDYPMANYIEVGNVDDTIEKLEIVSL